MLPWRGRRCSGWWPRPAGVVTLAEPGKYTIYYENRGELHGERFDTERRLAWPGRGTIVLACRVAYLEASDADAVEGAERPVVVRLVNQSEVYDFDDAQGHGGVAVHGRCRGAVSGGGELPIG